MTARPAPSETEIEAIVGHEFPGGEYTIEHWENFLLTECTGGELLPDGMVHPVALFHVPILGANTSIAEMFELGQAESDFSIGIESYDWEMPKMLYEDVTYRIDADATQDEICALVAQSQKRSAVYDIITNPTNVHVEVA